MDKEVRAGDVFQVKLDAIDEEAANARANARIARKNAEHAKKEKGDRSRKIGASYEQVLDRSHSQGLRGTQGADRTDAEVETPEHAWALSEVEREASEAREHAAEEAQAAIRKLEAASLKAKEDLEAVVGADAATKAAERAAVEAARHVATEKAEEERAAAVRADEERLVEQKAELARLAAEKAELEREAAERAAAEAERLAVESAEEFSARRQNPLLFFKETEAMPRGMTLPPWLTPVSEVDDTRLPGGGNCLGLHASFHKLTVEGEQTNAARDIQAVVRGKQARTRVAGMKIEKELGLTGSEEEQAAIARMQAQQRGKVARRDVAQMKASTSLPPWVTPVSKVDDAWLPSHGNFLGLHASFRKLTVEGEQTNAARDIQAIVRRKQARTRVAGMKIEAALGLTGSEEEQASIARMQAQHRGKQDRAMVAGMKIERELGLTGSKEEQAAIARMQAQHRGKTARKEMGDKGCASR